MNQREMIMGEDLYFDSQPEPILPQELFEQLKASGQATASRILQELTRLADEGDAEARQMLTRLGAMAVKLKENPGAELLPENWVRYRQVNWRYTVLEGHLLALAWLMTGARFIPIVRGAEPVWERPAAEPARPMPSSSAEEREDASSSPHAEAREEVIQVELRLLHLVERAGSPIPPALFQALPPERCTPAEVLFHLNMLALQGDLPAQKAMEKVDELAAQCREGTPLPPVSCREQNGVLVVVGEELSCLAAVAVGLEHIACQVTAEEIDQEAPPIAAVSARSAEAARPPQPSPQPAPAPSREWQELQAQIAHFARTRSGLRGLAQARQLASLLENITAAMPDTLVWETLGTTQASRPPSLRQREAAAREYLAHAVGISTAHLGRFLRLLSLPQEVQEEAKPLTERQLRPIFHLADPTLQLAVVRAVVTEQKQRGRQCPARSIQKLVKMINQGQPLKQALASILPDDHLLSQMHALAARARAMAENPDGITLDDFMTAYEELELALGKLRQALKASE